MDHTIPGHQNQMLVATILALLHDLKSPLVTLNLENQKV